MIKSITHFLIIFFIFQQLKSQISQIDQNGYNPFCDETLQIYNPYHLAFVSVICKHVLTSSTTNIMIPLEHLAKIHRKM